MQFPTGKVLKDAKFRRAAPFGKSGNWVHIVFDAATGDPKAMELIGLSYEWKPSIHLESAYMWLSLAMDNADPTSKAELKKHLNKQVLPKLNNRQIASTRKRLQRCKESNYTDCGTTSFKIFQK